MRTFTQVSHAYWWPGDAKHGLQTTLQDVRCANRNKNVTHRKRMPLYHIPTPDDALPIPTDSLRTSLLDLPPNGPHKLSADNLWIMDAHKPLSSLPCRNNKPWVQEWPNYTFDNVYQWFGLPLKVHLRQRSLLSPCTLDTHTGQQDWKPDKIY